MSKWNWKETEVGKAVDGKSGFTRFVGWLNSLFNENHSWFDYDKMDKSLSSVQNQLTQEGLTGQQVAMNDMQMQNVEDQYQRQVSGMQKAGLNPALMFQSGATTAPTASPSASNGINMSELIQMTLLPLQANMLKAQIGNVQANTAKTVTDTEQIKQIMDWYPRLSQANLDKLISSKGLDIANTNKAEAEKAIADIEKIIKGAEADNAPGLYKARVALTEAQTEAEKARKAKDLADEAWTAYETQYTKEHDGARPSSSSILALIDAISSWTGLDPGSEENKRVISTVIDDFNNPKGFYKKGIEQGKNLYKKGKSFLGRKFEQFKQWSNSR